ncbi:MAG: class IIb bacteriocin, lactobin A/cerein 7B family [Bacteroidales bacterium]|nr:class IIb bacteriocin, lactobin A/cerein 7B family [Bacteroidales bacterium]
MEPKNNEQLTELTEQELLETDGGFLKLGSIIIVVKRGGGSGPGKGGGGGPKF